MKNVEISLDDEELKNFLSLNTIKNNVVQHSVKISEGQINFNRVVFGFQTHLIGLKKVYEILRDMSFPDTHVHSIESLYYNSHEIGFGLEKTGAVLNYRIYFEKKYQYDEWKKIHDKNPELVPLFVAYKWNKDLNSDTEKDLVITNYCDIGYKNKDDLIKKMFDFCGFVPREIINEISCKNNASFFLRVFENGTKRNSYDLKFENSNFFMHSFDFSDIEKFFSIINLKDSLKKYKDLPINHIAGGLDRKGKVFLTLYFEEIISGV
jgi:hypothetical protein